MTPPITLDKKSILPSALIIGGGLANITAARALASRGYQVMLVTRQRPEQGQRKHSRIPPLTLEQLQEKDVIVKTWPDTLKLDGSPGNYEVALEYGSQADCVTAGAVLVDMGELNEGASPLLNTASDGRLLGRIIARTSNSGYLGSVGDDLLRETTIKESCGVFLAPPNDTELPKDQVIRGLATAARVSTYLEQVSIGPRAIAVDIDIKLCRGCGNCVDICPYIEMRERADGVACAYIDKALCLGCGACIASCPTGAITQPVQSDKQIISTLRSMLRPSQRLSEV
jgi:Heterodisulfide reductase, subunit A and related polyferredoxins